MSRRYEIGESLDAVHPEVRNADQINGALIDLERHPGIFVQWPFPELHAMTGAMAPGTVWFVCAASGSGKTTFVVSVIELWRLAGKRVYVMPLETRPKEFRTYLACIAAGIHPGEALSGNLRLTPHGEAQRLILKGQLHAQFKPEFADRVMISEHRAIDLSGLTAGLKEAKSFGADVVIVDHIDHIAGGDGSNMYSEAKAVNDGALHMAQDNDLLLLFTSQLNMSASRGDYLSKYLPPKIDHVAFGTLKQRNASGMLGLFRPLRKPRPDENEKDYLDAMKAARAGTGNITDALEPNTMGISAMKLRNFGNHEGGKIYLSVDQGRVSTLAEKDRWQTGNYPRRVI